MDKTTGQNLNQDKNILEEPAGSVEFQLQGRHRDQRMRMEDQDLDKDRMRDEGGWRYTDDADEEFINLNYPPPKENKEGNAHYVDNFKYPRY
jgi:hypothetical protein